MSYSIIYEKQFIKISETEVIPVILTGDNNVYEHSGARARDWYNPLVNGKRVVTIDDINEELNHMHKQYFNPRNAETANRSEKDFGYYSGIAMYGKGTHKTTWGMYKNVYLKGFEQALTLEQLSNESISVSVRITRLSGSPVNPDVDALSKGGFNTTAELLSHIEKCKAAIKENKGYHFFIYLNGYDLEKKVKRIRRKYFPTTKKVKVPTEVDSFYAITIDTYGNYLTESKKGSINYSRWSDSAKAFLTEKQAEAQIKRLNKRRWNNLEFNVIKVNEKRTILV